ncbi:hypothetical protein [Halobacterium zhouii]|uniref:hypothetical protein n=1 Tax=Halobacterium zhouii TaxID=2902624 RepID=UPI001E494256|nr:hypothetical protein [Halobacterium zhouii]
MSADDAPATPSDAADLQDAQDTVTGTVQATYPRPRAHGAAVGNVLNDLAPSERANAPQDRSTLYQTAVDYWMNHVQDADAEPYIAVPDFSASWLPDDGKQYALVTKSSRWKAGVGHGDDYTAFYEQHLMLRRVQEDDDGERELSKGPLALHVEIMPQYADLVYASGDPLQYPDEYGEGTRVVAWTTWADSGEAVETRAYDAIRAVYGADALDVARDRNDDARRIQKAEAHIRFAQPEKNAVVDAVEQSQRLIDYGGQSEIDAYQNRVQAGWQEARVESDRWKLLGFDAQPYSTELKVYQPRTGTNARYRTVSRIRNSKPPLAE